MKRETLAMLYFYTLMCGAIGYGVIGQPVASVVAASTGALIAVMNAIAREYFEGDR